MSSRKQRRQRSTAPPARTASGASQYDVMQAWNGKRNFEAGETNRLNEAHWVNAEDCSINVWIAEQLATIRARTALEERNNGLISGVIGTHCDDVVGPAGPTLQVISDDDAYNTALEQLWREWFAAPTTRPNVSGAAMLKLWVRSLWKCGEFLAQLVTDPQATGPIKLRVRPIHPRRLASPADAAGNPRVFMGIEFDLLDRPTRYWITRGTSINGREMMAVSEPWSPDLIIHEFVAMEEEQGRGVPWLASALQPAADLRDFDSKIQDAATQMADQSSLLFTRSPDVPVWQVPESMSVERRTIRMVPPGWEPWNYPATQPPVQYPDYRAERQRDIGRPVGMPLLIVRLDASKHNYSSARLDTQVYRRAVAGIQYWISGGEQAVGTLSRLADEVAREGRFAVPGLRVRPDRVIYRWTWPGMPHVDPQKEANAEETALGNCTISLTDALAARGKDLESHIETLRRERALLEEAGLEPVYAAGPAPPVAQPDPAEAEPEREENADA